MPGYRKKNLPRRTWPVRPLGPVEASYPNEKDYEPAYFDDPLLGWCSNQYSLGNEKSDTYDYDYDYERDDPPL